MGFVFFLLNLFYCLENRDVLVKILGRSFATVLEREGARADGLSLVEKVKEEDSSKVSEVKVKLFLLLQNTDKQILSKLLSDISEWVLLFYLRLSSHSVRLPIHPLWYLLSRRSNQISYDMCLNLTGTGSVSRKAAMNKLDCVFVFCLSPFSQTSQARPHHSDE